MSNPTPFRQTVTLLLLLAAVATSESAAQNRADKISFDRDVRPILAATCLACHGPDEKQREAGLRLDRRDQAISSGAIKPGEPKSSELIARIFAIDEDELMPPADAENRLTPAQKETLRRWIAEGAKYEKHWALIPPTRPALPEFPDQPEAIEWIRNPIDRFVLMRLQKEKLNPSPEADRYTLVRRVYLDLIGLPPTPKEVDAFVHSSDPEAYKKLVDQLLSSPRYGERWAQPWLDLARYSDTNGYEKDRPRSIWPYRDWVIRALNEDLPYDQFTLHQLAGDMLPDPTPDQLVATGFHRNTMLNEEGGIDPLEYRFYAMVDRVATTGVVWMGLTTGCAQCHTHKFDPISHTDYYRLMALMNNTEEPDFLIPDPTRQKRRDQLKRQIAQLERKLEDSFPVGEGNGPERELRNRNLNREFDKWHESVRSRVARWKVLRPTATRTNSAKLTVMEDGSLFSSGDITKRDLFELTFDLESHDRPISAIRIEAIPDERLPAGGPGRTFYEGRKGDFFLSEIDATVDGKQVDFFAADDSYQTTNPKKKGPNLVLDGIGSSGWQPFGNKAKRLQFVARIRQPLENAKELKLTLLFERHYAASLGRFRVSVTSSETAVANRLPEPIEKLIAEKESRKWTKTERSHLMLHFLRTTPLLAEARKPIDQLRQQMPRPTETMVMRERDVDNPRPTFRHHRGEFLSPREKVTAGIPEIFLTASGPAKQPGNRLEFARWLVSESNPLVGRVAVNRAWREFFGTGIVETPGDFGVESESPSHPELLDWLAIEFRQNGWSTKSLHRLIVTSATYRQASPVTTELLKRDPQNRLLARGPRFRISGEMLRDSILKSSGLLSSKMYGPGVRPPQPASVTALAYGATRWTASQGEDRFRRSIYSFRKRTAAFAAYSVFDGPSGENCVAKRNRSNTPLQALTVLNDEMFVEMARAMGIKVAKRELSEQDQIVTLFRQILVRPPVKQETEKLVRFYRAQMKRLETGQLNAKQIVGLNSNEAAALAMVARVLMNLDETVTKQ